MTEINPFTLLGIKPTTDVDTVRRAYHLQAMKIHPDKFQDPEQQKIAHEKMVALNQAYEQALRLTGAQKAPYTQNIECDDAVRLAKKMLTQRSPESALRQLLRANTRTAEWFYVQGVILLEMFQYESAHQSFREAVRREPDNMIYRRGALNAAVEMKRSKTLGGKIKKLFHKK